MSTKPELQPCGTPAAWRRHRRRNEQPCIPCLDAIHAHDKARKARTRKTKNPKPATAMSRIPEQTFIEEVTFLHNAGEGTARILAATGYTGREKVFRARCKTAGIPHLADRILISWELAA